MVESNMRVGLHSTSLVDLNPTKLEVSGNGAPPSVMLVSLSVVGPSRIELSRLLEPFTAL